MKTTVKIVLIAVFAGLLPRLALASGIEVSEQSAAAQGRALAVGARLEEASTLFYNPAGLGFLTGTQIQLGDTFIVPRFSYTDARELAPGETKRPGDTTDNVVPPPHFYISHAMPLAGGNLGLGLGLNFPYGMAVHWGEDFAGRHLVSEVELLLPQIMVGAAYAPNKKFSVGASMSIIPGQVYLEKYLGEEYGLVDDAGDPVEDAKVQMQGGGLALAVNLGIQYRPIEGLYLGLAYRGRSTLDMEGDAHFSLGGVSDGSSFPDQKLKSSVNLPDLFTLAVGYQVMPVWYTEVNVNYTVWSVFKEIPMTFPNDATGRLSQVIEEDWQSGWTLRWGNEVRLNKALALRAGTGIDQNPVKDDLLSPMLPDSNRFFASLGAGYSFPFGLTVDASYMVTIWMERTVKGTLCPAGSTDPACADLLASGNYEDGSVPHTGNEFPGTYSSIAHLLAMTVGYQF